MRFYERCIDTGRPKSPTTIERVLATLRLLLGHAQAGGIVTSNAVADWKSQRQSKGRRRSAPASRVTPDMVLTAEELSMLLAIAQSDYPARYPFILFMADTGARIGEASALRWSEVAGDLATARIVRSFSSSKHLGPTKTGQERTVELSSRLQEMPT